MKKLAIFGAGSEGMTVLRVFGEQNIACFVDNRRTGKILNVETINLEELLPRWQEFVIVVAAYRGAEEIAAQLLNAGIDQFYVWGSGYEEIYFRFRPTYMYANRNIPFDYGRLIEKIAEGFNSIAVYSYAEHLPILLIWLDIFELTDKTVHIIPHTLHGIELVSFKKIENDIDCLLVAVRRSDNNLANYLDLECDRLDAGAFVVSDFYNVDQHIEEFWCPEIVALKDTHIGESCFVVANGPSLRAEDLQKLHDNKKASFGCNKIYNIYDKTDWRPDYYCVADGWVYKQNYEAIKQTTAPFVFLGKNTFESGDVETIPNAYQIHISLDDLWPEHKRFGNTGITTDISKQTFWGGFVTLDFMIPLAIYMGYTTIYLLGVDNSIPGVLVDTSHFYKTESDEIKTYSRIGKNETQINRKFKTRNSAYEKYDKWTRRHGIRIFNATRGGMLEAFERVDFDSLFE
jgi:hypothetical protein